MIHGTLTMWTVYDHPKDYPGGFIARRWEIGKGVVAATGDVVTGSDLSAIRRVLLDKGLVRMVRHADDDPVITETWV